MFILFDRFFFTIKLILLFNYLFIKMNAFTVLYQNNYAKITVREFVQTKSEKGKKCDVGKRR